MCPENQRKRNMSSTHEIYQQIYSRYGVKAFKSSVGFKPLFARNYQCQEDQEGMYNWDSADKNINKLSVNINANNENDKITKLEQQMDKFMDLLKKLNERVSNLEINYINQAEPQNNRLIELSFEKEDNTFMNANNKHVKQFQQNRDIYIERHNISDAQSHTFSPIEEDSKAIKIIENEQFVYKPSMSLNESPSSPKPQGENSQ
ncbi:hypothetical protein C1646_673318 [Rhizophagus diaphanus]|nr:hypothetical protein C1646_673318 [Rhizophagus diaphanus] [Rhizophagus sp. MUCL 43196]